MTESDTLLSMGFAELVTQHGKAYAFKGKTIYALESKPVINDDLPPRGFTPGLEFNLILSFRKSDFDTVSVPVFGDYLQDSAGRKHPAAGSECPPNGDYIRVYINQVTS